MTELTYEQRVQKNKETLAKYGLKNDLFLLVSKPAFTDNTKDAGKTAKFRLRNQKGEYFTATQYIKPEKVGGAQEAFIASMEPGRLYSVNYMEHNYNGQTVISVSNAFARKRLSDYKKEA